MDDCLFGRIIRIFSAHGQCQAFRIGSLTSAPTMGVLSLYECDNGSVAAFLGVGTLLLYRFHWDIPVSNETHSVNQGTVTIACL